MTIEVTAPTPERNEHRGIFSLITWICRILIGGLFIFSGFSKGLDVWGTIFKFGDYWAAMGLTVWEALNVVGVFFLCLFEFLTGVFLLLGCFRKAAPVCAALIMAFMLPLSFWVAVWEPVADCGCFGDAIKLSNWATFWKNVIIVIFVAWLWKYNRRSSCLITPYLQWIAATVSGAFFLIVAWLGYYYQPLIDFRPYPEGSEFLVPDTDSDGGEDKYMVFVYERDGVKKEFRIDDVLPDEEEGWVFVEKRIEIPEEMYDINGVKEKESEKSIRIWEGEEDITGDLAHEEKVLYLMIPDMDAVPAAKTFKINSMYEWCMKNGIEMVAVVGGNPDQISKWVDLSLAEYPIYTADDTAIKEVVRGNPAVVYTENNIIQWKSSLKALNTEDFMDGETSSDPKSFGHDNGRILMNLTLIYIAVLAILILMSLFPKLGRLSKFKGRLKITQKKLDDNEKDAR